MCLSMRCTSISHPPIHFVALLTSFSLQSGYSRFPVHEKGNKDAFIGLLLVKMVCIACNIPTPPLRFDLYTKQLLTYDPKKALPVSAFPLSILPEASPSINCFQALDYLCVCLGICFFKGWTFDRVFLLCKSQTGRAHLLLISRTPGLPGGAIGVITLEGEMVFFHCYRATRVTSNISLPQILLK